MLAMQNDDSNVETIAKMLNMNADDVNKIVGTTCTDDNIVLQAIKNDVNFEINSKGDLKRKTGLSDACVNASLERLINTGKLSIERAWKHELIPSCLKTLENDDNIRIVDLFRKGYSTELISYLYSVNYNVFRKRLSTLCAKKDEKNSSSSKNRNKMFMDAAKIFEHNFNRLTVGMDTEAIEILKRNFKKFVEDSVDYPVEEELIMRRDINSSNTNNSTN